MKYEYLAISIQQTSSDKRIVLFAAPAVEINDWAGIPQKKQFGSDAETVGFQREENTKRLNELGEFCSNPANIIQNPLLCATRFLPFASATFQPSDQSSALSQDGRLIIEVPDYDSLNILEILGQVRDYIESRVPELKSASPNESLILALKKQAVNVGHELTQSDEEEKSQADDDDPINLDSFEADASEVSGVLFEESHIVDFWQEIASRHELAKLMDHLPDGDDFLGFSRDSLISYLRPVVLVDGQHRLKGALKSVDDSLRQEVFQREIEERLSDGESADAVRSSLYYRLARTLPVSLLLSNDPAEQVFQFVVVNQKATPVGRALLGTIVSTTLSNGEMESVATRLKDAGIALEESQAVTFLARSPDSPFFGLVERGLAGGSKQLLQWGVFSSLISIFRDLRGGKLFGNNNDYASIWRHKFLEASSVVAKYELNGLDSQYIYWKSLDGPWREVFIRYFSRIRDIFGDTKDSESHNYWGNPRQSNLFNKISLTILAADFFQFLVERKMGIEDVESISSIMDDWLEGVNPNYFNRDWNLSGVKKDAAGIRRQWAFLWGEYRKNPSQLPQAKMFRVSKSA